MAKLSKTNNEILIAIYYNIKTAMQNLTNVIEKVEDSKLKKLMTAQLDDYTRYQDTCEDLAKVYEIDVLDNNMLKKAQMWINVNMALMFDRSNRKIASINIFGTTMGIIDLIGLLSDYKKAREEFIALGNQILELEKSNIEALKPFLLKENQKQKSKKQTPQSNEKQQKESTAKKGPKNATSSTVKKSKQTSPALEDDLYNDK